MDSNPQFSPTAVVERLDALEQMVSHRLRVVEGRLAELVNPAADSAAQVEEARPAGAPTFVPVQHPWSEAQRSPEPVTAAAGVAAVPPPPAASPRTTAEAVVQPPPPTAAQAYVPVEAQAYTPVERRPLDVEALLRWVGVSLVTLAAIFLIGTAIDRGWLTPEMQLVGAALAGAGLLGAALHFGDKRPSWATAMGVGGSIALTATAAASYGWREMVAPDVSMVLVAVALAASLAVAWRLDRDSVGAVAMFFALVAPTDAYDVLAAAAPPLWMLAVMGFGMVLGLLRNWPGTRLVSSWTGALMLFCFSIFVGFGDTSIVFGLIGTIGGSLVLLAGPLLAERLTCWESTERGDLRALDLRSLAVVPAFTWVSILALGDGSSGTAPGVVGLAAGAVFVLIAALAWFAASKIGAVSIGLGASGVIAVALLTLLDAPVLMVVLAAQAVASLVLARVLNDEPLRLSAYVLGAVASLIAVGETLAVISVEGFETVGVALATFVVVALWAVAAWLGFSNDGPTSRRFSVPFVGAWVGLGLWLFAALLAVPQGLSLVSGAWAIMAGAALVVGLAQRIDLVRTVGLATLALTLAKLFSVDLAEVDVLVRVILFFGVGVGLIALGLKVPNLISRSDDTPDDEPGQSSLPPVISF